MRKSRFTEEQIIRRAQEAEAGANVVSCAGAMGSAGNVLPLEEEVRRHAGRAKPRLKQLEDENRAAEADRGRPGAESAGAEGSPGKQVVTARERRQVVEKIQAAEGVSERRALRFTGFARSTIRYQLLGSRRKRSAAGSGSGRPETPLGLPP